MLKRDLRRKRRVLRVYKIDKKHKGKGDRAFLQRAFHKQPLRAVHRRDHASSAPSLGIGAPRGGGLMCTLTVVTGNDKYLMAMNPYSLVASHVPPSPSL